MGRSSKDKRDIFYRLAKEEGWRARSAFKLLQIANQFDLFNGVTRAVDLCAAPGSWSQVLAQSLKSTAEQGQNFIVAVDLQAMSPIAGVKCIQGDITKESTALEIISSLGDKKADIVVCDGAPDVTGLHQLDEYLQAQLLLAALNISTLILSPGGTFLAKFFRASADGIDSMFSKVSIFFEDVIITKPRSSRASSIECFVLARKFKLPDNFTPRLYDPFSNEVFFQNLDKKDENIIRYVACGDLDGFDSDTTYSISDPNYKSLQPVQGPIDPPYLEAVAMRKSNTLATSNANKEAKMKTVGKSMLTITLSFGGGAEKLVGDVREKIINIPYSDQLNMVGLLDWMKGNMLTERPELLIKDNDIRPGVLVLINDTDWELMDKLDYKLKENDVISFISTLHGG